MLNTPYFTARGFHCLILLTALIIFVQIKGFCASDTSSAYSVNISSQEPSTIAVSSGAAVTVITSSSAPASAAISASTAAPVSVYASSSPYNAIYVCPPTTEDQLQKLREKLPEMKIQETVINVSPKMRVYLPSGAFDLNLKEEYRRTALDFNTKYDLVNSIMGYGFDFLYNISPLALGINFADTVNFDQIYSGTQYLQRSQSVTPYVQRAITKDTKIKTSLRIENTYTDAVSSDFVLDKGKNILGEIGVWNDYVKESTSAPSGGSASFVIQHSFENLGSDYDYTQLEFNFRHFYKVFTKDYVECEFQSGFPSEVGNRPLTSLYFLGGYRILRGYKFQEFTGDAKVYASVKYNIPLTKVTEQQFFEQISVAMLSWNIFSEGAKIGGKEIYTTPGEPKFSAGTGIGYNVVFFRLFPVKLELSVAKAFENRPEAFYFTVSTLYYTWRN